MEKDNFNQDLVILNEQYAENKLVRFFVIFQTVRIISETFFLIDYDYRRKFGVKETKTNDGN
jgi:hypothetical protein